MAFLKDTWPILVARAEIGIFFSLFLWKNLRRWEFHMRFCDLQNWCTHTSTKKCFETPNFLNCPPLICIQILACMYLKHVFQVTYHNDFGVGKDKRFLISSGISGNNLGQIEKLTTGNTTIKNVGKLRVNWVDKLLPFSKKETALPFF